MDLGAYNGDTIDEVLQYTRGKYIRIYAVEPDRKNFKKLCKYLDGKNFVYAYNAVAWCLDTTCCGQHLTGQTGDCDQNGRGGL